MVRDIFEGTSVSIEVQKRHMIRTCFSDFIPAVCLCPQVFPAFCRLERFKKYYSRFAPGEKSSGLFESGLRFGSVTGPYQACAFAKASSRLKNPRSKRLEHFKKYYSRLAERKETAVFLGFGFVSAQSQAIFGMLLRQSLAKTPKILAPDGYSIF